MLAHGMQVIGITYFVWQDSQVQAIYLAVKVLCTKRCDRDKTGTLRV